MIIPHIRIRKILYATDLSDTARYAFAYAVNLSQMYQAGLTILHVMEEIPRMDERISSYISEKQWEEIKQRNMDDARAVLIGKQQGHVTIGAVLEQFCAEAKKESGEPARFTVDEILIKRGNPVAKILEAAELKGCDVIVMGMHGLGTLAKLVMGSTAQRVIQRSAIPVFVVKLPKTD